MKSFTIRFNVEVKAENEDEAGKCVNDLITTANDVIECEHYEWAITQGKIDDADTEKNLRKAMLTA